MRPDDGAPTMVTSADVRFGACPACGAAGTTSRFCRICGEVQPSGPLDEGAHPASDAAVGPSTGPSTPCARCDGPLETGDRYCPRCGAAALGTAAARPPGWFADPFGRQPLRWWDGAGWTAYAAGEGTVWDPLTFEAPEPVVGVRGVGVAIAGFVVGVAVAFGVTALLHGAGEPGGRATLLVLSELGLWSGLVGACFLVTRRRGTRSLTTDFGLRFRVVDIPLGVAGLIGGRIAAAFVALPIVAAFPDLDPPRGGVYGTGHIDTIEWIALVAVVCVGAPFVEELFFRGLVQTRLVSRYGPAVGIGITSVLFGAAHLIGWVGPITFVYAGSIVGAGVVLGALRHWSGRLGPSILAHVCFNVQAVVVVALLR